MFTLTSQIERLGHKIQLYAHPLVLVLKGAVVTFAFTFERVRVTLGDDQVEMRLIRCVGNTVSQSQLA